MIYTTIFIIFLISFSTQLYDNKEINSLKLIFLYISVFFLSIFVGINTNRNDFSNYLYDFNESPLLNDSKLYEYSKKAHSEIGYNYFQALFKTVVNSPTIFFIIFCNLSILIRISFYKKFVKISDFLIIFFAFLSNEFLKKDCVQIRNGFASSIILFSLVYLYQNKKKLFIFFVLIASCFHLASLVALPLYFIKSKYKDKYFYTSIFIFLFSLLVSIFLPLKTILLLLYKSGFLPSKIGFYLDGDIIQNEMKIISPTILKQLLVFFYVCLFCKNELKDKKLFFLFQVYLVSTIYFIMFRSLEIFAGRFGGLFYGVEPVLLVEIVNKVKNKKIGKTLILLFYFTFFVYNFITYKNILGWNIGIY